MKKMRKGFTLVELLIVIGIIGILGAMGTIGGSEANNIASASKIIEDFNIISAAMSMYYADNKAACDAGKVSLETGAGNLDAAAILTGVTPYMKSVALLSSAEEVAEGKYTISIGTDKSWWLAYKIPANNAVKIGNILKNKASQQMLKKSAASSAGAGTAQDPTTINLYDGGDTVYMQVR